MQKLVGHPYEIKYDENGNCLAAADFVVSTVSDLPAKDGEVTGTPYGTVKAQPGSHAEVVQAGLIATMDEDGKWYADGAEVS